MLSSMPAKYSVVSRDRFEVPLLGIPPSAVADYCDSCGGIFPYLALQICADGNHFLCAKCREAGKEKKTLISDTPEH